MKNILYLHTGSNDGNRLSFLEFACKMIEKKIGDIMAFSIVYETKAWGKEDQADFLNQALKVETKLKPSKVLKEIQKIEKKSGRKRQIRWGTRTLDIDILFYGEKIIDKKKLTIPHPRLHTRKFVLVPLSEIAGNFQHPLLGLTVDELLKQCEDDLEVWKFYGNKY